MRMLICACMVAMMALAASAEGAKADCATKKEAKAALTNGVDSAKAAKKAVKKNAAKNAVKKDAAAAKKAAKAAAAK